MKKVIIAITIMFLSIVLVTGENIYAKSKKEIIQGNKLIEYSGNAKEYIVPKEVKVIQADAFAKAKKLKKVTIHKNVKSIRTSYRGTLYAPKLEKIIVAKTNKKYASYKGCLYKKNMKQLLAVPYYAKELYMSDKCIGIADEARYTPFLDSIRIGKNFIDSGYDEMECSPLKAKNKVTVAKGNAVFSEKNGVIYYKKGNDMFLYSIPTDLVLSENFEVPANVSRIQSLSNNHIRKLIIPKSVKYAECGAIQLPNLEEMEIANDCSGIFFWSKTLSNCPNLKKIIITNDNAAMPTTELNLKWNEEVVIYSRVNSTSHKYAVENNLQWTTIEE